MKLLLVFGTRPEAIKMAPILLALREEPGIDPVVCVTGQHREMLDQVLRLFGIVPDFDLGLMQSGQGLNSLVADALSGLAKVYDEVAPDRILVQGDTSTAMAAALAAFHRRLPVAHVEAGLRTYATGRPFPEEMNRRIVDLASDLLFAPTGEARANLIREGAEGRIFVTGNSGIDSLAIASARLAADPDLVAAIDSELPDFDPERRLLLVTGHRRESLGAGLGSLCTALKQLAASGRVEIVYPVHLNPDVRAPVEQTLGATRNVHLLAPLDYLRFVRLMQRADLVLTDSGGIQEEAPALGLPCLVTRELTERPEAIEAGSARVVGTNAARIIFEVSRALEEGGRRSPAASPYGDGRASERIVGALAGRKVDEFDCGSAAAVAAAR